MELPDVIKEKLVELVEENNQLRAEVSKLRIAITTKDEILNELEEENVQLRKNKEREGVVCLRCTQLEQNITSLNTMLDEKHRESRDMTERIEALTASLTSAHGEIEEYRRARTPMSPERSIVVETSNSSEMIRVQEERDDAIFELQRANHRISALELERDDLSDRAEAANAEAREMARHLRELREQLHETEAELAASRSSVSIANRGNSMFAEFAEERVRLEADMKTLFSKYESVRMQNCQLSNELDEARLLALRRTRSEASARCRCHELSPELIQLRGRVQTLEERLAKARNELIDAARVTKGIDPRLKSFYRSLKIEMESLRQERDMFRDERDKLIDEKVRVANAEKSVDWANNDVESLKLQLAMMKERDQKKDVAKVVEMVNGESNGEVLRVSSILNAVKSTPSSCFEQNVKTPAGVPCAQNPSRNFLVPPYTPLVPSDQNCSFNSTLDISERVPTEVRLKKLRFADADHNEKEDTQRRESISASELRRIARKQARRAHSKVLPIGEPLIKVSAKISNPSASQGRQEVGLSTVEPLEPLFSCSSQGEELQSERESSLMESSTVFEAYGKNTSARRRTSSFGREDSALDHSLSSMVSERQPKPEDVLPLSGISENRDESEVNISFKRYSTLEPTNDFNKTLLEDVPEEKENDVSCKSSQEGSRENVN